MKICNSIEARTNIKLLNNTKKKTVKKKRFDKQKRIYRYEIIINKQITSSAHNNTRTFEFWRLFIGFVCTR